MTDELYSTRGGCAMTTKIVDNTMEAMKAAVVAELQTALGTTDIPHIKLEIDKLVAMIELMNERLDLVCSQNNQLVNAMVPKKTQGGGEASKTNPYYIKGGLAPP